jgi:hypothetical protein
VHQENEFVYGTLKVSEIPRLESLLGKLLAYSCAAGPTNLNAKAVTETLPSFPPRGENLPK